MVISLLIYVYLFNGGPKPVEAPPKYQNQQQDYKANSNDKKKVVQEQTEYKRSQIKETEVGSKSDGRINHQSSTGARDLLKYPRKSVSNAEAVKSS